MRRRAARPRECVTRKRGCASSTWDYRLARLSTQLDQLRTCLWPPGFAASLGFAPFELGRVLQYRKTEITISLADHQVLGDQLVQDALDLILVRVGVAGLLHGFENSRRCLHLVAEFVDARGHSPDN